MGGRGREVGGTGVSEVSAWHAGLSLSGRVRSQIRTIESFLFFFVTVDSPVRRTGVVREMMRRTGSRLMVWGQVHGGPLHPVTMADAITAS